MLEQPKIYVSAVPDNETTRIPADAVDLTSGTMGYMVNDNIDGLARPDADFSISALAGANASRIGGRQITERNIVMDIIPLPDFRINRERLYHILPFGETRRFYIETQDRCVFIDGEIEKLNGAFKPDKPFGFGVSIICPFPWFQSVRLHTMKLVVGENTVRNDGDVPAGFCLEINNDDPEGATINNLSLSIGGESFGYTGAIVAPYICTIPGRKKFNSISRDGSPAFGMMNNDSEWLLLNHGKNILTASTTTASKFEASNILYFRDTYSGV